MLKEKIIIITGGSGLLGKFMIRDIEQKGGRVINLDVNVKTHLNKNTVYCDVTRNSSVDDALKMVLENYGKIDGIINNAYPRTSDWGNTFENTSLASWNKNIQNQLNSVFYLCKEVSKTMKKNGGGSIVNISSIYGMVGPDFTVYEGTNMTSPVAYSAIKGAIINFTRYLASYLGKYGIRANCVSPGGIFDNQPEIFVAQYTKKVPLRRMGRPQDIAPAVSFLQSDESSYITGHNLVVDGGWTVI